MDSIQFLWGAPKSRAEHGRHTALRGRLAGRGALRAAHRGCKAEEHMPFRSPRHFTFEHSLQVSFADFCGFLDHINEPVVNFNHLLSTFNNMVLSIILGYFILSLVSLME